jgi:uncharacterized protein YndB with AHSA1/START domain
MGDPTEPIVLRRMIAAPPERVFRAFTTRDDLARWMSPVGHAEVEVDARIGGLLRVSMIGAGRRIEHVGRFVELDPPHRLAFTWQSAYTGDVATRVTVDLLSGADAGTTEVVLRHELLPETARTSHAQGWGVMLDRLSAIAATQEEVTHGA